VDAVVTLDILTKLSPPSVWKASLKSLSMLESLRSRRCPCGRFRKWATVVQAMMPNRMTKATMKARPPDATE
jgi:hypothetical protein